MQLYLYTHTIIGTQSWNTWVHELRLRKGNNDEQVHLWPSRPEIFDPLSSLVHKNVI